jgi:chromosome segregation ATPase
MDGLQQLFSSDLPIPLWQIVFYVGLVSYFMVQRWFKLSFLTSFVLVLYWLHYAFRSDLVAVTTEAHLARAIYYVLGFALILLSIFALTFLEVDTDSLLEKREKEITLLKAQAKNAEKTAAALQAELEKDQSQESSAKKKRERKLNSKIERLEQGLQDAERLLETRTAQITALQAQAAEAEKNAAAFEALLEMYQTQESNSKKKLEEELNAKIETLQLELREGESLLAQRDAQVSVLQARASELESNASVLEAQSQNSSAGESTSGVEEALRAQIDQLKGELSEKETLLEKYTAEIAGLRARASELQADASALSSGLESKLADESAAAKKREEELTVQIDQLKTELKESEGHLKVRTAEVAQFRDKASEADKKNAALKAQLEKDQSQGSVSKKKLEEKFHARIAKLEDQLKQSESLLEKRNAELAELHAKASEAEEHVGALKAELEKDQLQQSIANNKLQEELNARTASLEAQLKQAEALLGTRQKEIAGLQARASVAETHASTIREELEKHKTEVFASRKKHDEELNARIAKLENELKQGENLLEQRAAEIAQLRAKAADAEKDVQALNLRLEKEHHNESAANRKLERELNGKITALEEKLKEYHTLLENRNSEISALQAKAAEAEKNGVAVAARLEADKNRVVESKTKLQEELRIRISDLENQLQQSEDLLKTRGREITELKAEAAQSEKNAAALKAQLEKDTTQASSAKKTTDELNGRIAKLEAQLKHGETVLKARNSEIAALQAKASEAEKSASALKAQLEKDTTQVSSDSKKLEGELNSKIAKLEKQLKESQSLLEKRNAEIADFKATAAEAIKGASTIKPSSTTNRPSVHAQASDDKSTSEEDVRRKLHQFQYAVKYLEDEIKEKDRLLSLMAKKNSQAQTSTKNVVDEDFKKKIHQLEQAVKYLENQSKEKDGLLSLMAKRNRELADLKSKAEERLEALEANIHGDQNSKSGDADIGTER